MKTIFDESIFTNGRCFDKNKIILINNRADEYLLKLLSLPFEYNFTQDKNNYIFLNPKKLYNGINCFTLYPKFKKTNHTHFFNKIIVFKDVLSSNLLDFTSPNLKDDIIYDFNPNMNRLESAIMLKYFSKFKCIYITEKLFLFVYDKMLNTNIIFEYNCCKLLQTKYNEVLNFHEKTLEFLPMNNLYSNTFDL